MTDARLQEIAPDEHGAMVLFAQAELFLEDACSVKLANESRVVLAHNAATAAADAVLAAAGLRVTSGDKAHVLRLSSALAQFDGDNYELLQRLDDSRARRNDASYSGLPVGAFSVSDAIEATTEFVEMVRTRVG